MEPERQWGLSVMLKKSLYDIWYASVQLPLSLAPYRERVYEKTVLCDWKILKKNQRAATV